MNAKPPGSEKKVTSLKMRFGRDLRYHFEDPELRRRGGDGYEFDGTERDWLLMPQEENPRTDGTWATPAKPGYY